MYVFMYECMYVRTYVCMFIVLLGNVEGKILWRRGCRWGDNIKKGGRNRMCLD